MGTIKVLGQRVLVKKEPKENLESVYVARNQIYIPNEKEENIAKVEVVSEGIKDIKVGDIIYYSIGSGEIEGYLVIEYKNILAKK